MVVEPMQYELSIVPYEGSDLLFYVALAIVGREENRNLEMLSFSHRNPFPKDTSYTSEN